jgi:hypothetical protein
MDGIPAHQTSCDIETYIRNELCDVDELREAKYQADLNALIWKAGTSFQWAATTCHFICSDSDAGTDLREQIERVLHADSGLYVLYSTVMREHCNPSNKMQVK